MPPRSQAKPKLKMKKGFFNKSDAGPAVEPDAEPDVSEMKSVYDTRRSSADSTSRRSNVYDTNSVNLNISPSSNTTNEKKPEPQSSSNEKRPFLNKVIDFSLEKARILTKTMIKFMPLPPALQDRMAQYRICDCISKHGDALNGSTRKSQELSVEEKARLKYLEENHFLDEEKPDPMSVVLKRSLFFLDPKIFLKIISSPQQCILANAPENMRPKLQGLNIAFQKIVLAFYVLIARVKSGTKNRIILPIVGVDDYSLKDSVTIRSRRIDEFLSKTVPRLQKTIYDRSTSLIKPMMKRVERANKKYSEIISQVKSTDPVTVFKDLYRFAQEAQERGEFSD